MNSKVSLVPLFVAFVYWFFIFNVTTGNISCPKTLFGNNGACSPGLEQCQKEMEEYYKDAISVLAMNCQNDGDYHACLGVAEYNAPKCPPSSPPSNCKQNTVKEMTTNFGKLDKFEGHDFRRWQKKMHFLLITLKVVYVLTTSIQELMEDDTVEAIRRRAKWENDYYICREHISNSMSDSLFDIYWNVESVKELWNSFESKYMAEDASSKKFFASIFYNYKMVDTRPVMEQFNELLRILRQYTQHGLKMDKSIYFTSVLDKLPPFWKDFKHTLKHGKDDLSLVQFGSHLRIKESLRAQDSDNDKGKKVVRSSMNITGESGKNKNNKQNKDSGRNRIAKRKLDDVALGWSNKAATETDCNNVDFYDLGVLLTCIPETDSQEDDIEKRRGRLCVLTVAHINVSYLTEFKSVLVPTRNQNWNLKSVARLVTSRSIVVVVKRTTQMLVVRERGLRTNPKTKIDSGATTHDRCWFKTYEPVEDGSILYMGDDHFAPVHGK
nr:zinc finger, CCHC-type [Tanacetum cinerariifolium]